MHRKVVDGIQIMVIDPCNQRTCISIFRGRLKSTGDGGNLFKQRDAKTTFSICVCVLNDDIPRDRKEKNMNFAFLLRSIKTSAKGAWLMIEYEVARKKLYQKCWGLKDLPLKIFLTFLKRGTKNRFLKENYFSIMLDFISAQIFYHASYKKSHQIAVL